MYSYQIALVFIFLIIEFVFAVSDLLDCPWRYFSRKETKYDSSKDKVI
jgi:hypothetical protein